MIIIIIIIIIIIVIIIIRRRRIIINTLDEQVFPRELQAILNSLPLWDSWECFI